MSAHTPGRWWVVRGAKDTSPKAVARRGLHRTLWPDDDISPGTSEGRTDAYLMRSAIDEIQDLRRGMALLKAVVAVQKTRLQARGETDIAEHIRRVESGRAKP